MKNKTTKISIGIVIVALLAWWGVAMVDRNENKVPPTEVGTIEQHEKGNVDSKIEIVEFSDFQCPACAGAEAMVDQLILDFDNIKVVYKHYPLNSIHPNAHLAAAASESAGIQGKFWEMHDVLFENQSAWSNSINPKKIFIGYAKDLGLDVNQFVADLENESVLAKIENDIADGDEAGVKGTPSFYVNGVYIENYGQLEAIINPGTIKE